MPGDRDVPDDRPRHVRSPAQPNLVVDRADTVGYLDAADTRPDDLVAAVLTAFERLVDGGVLTVYSRLPDVEAILTEMSDRHPVAVIGAITHPGGGTTLTLRVR